MISGRLRNYIVNSICLLLLTQISYGQIKFAEIAEEAGIDHHYLGVNEMGAGAAFFDVDNDEDDDLWIAGGLNMDALYLNDGEGNFTSISQSAGLGITNNIVTTGVITGDIDNDGFTDALLITHRGFTNVLMRNNGDNTFTNVTLGSGVDDYKAYSLAAAFGDINLDGYLDLYAAHYIAKDKFAYDANEEIVGFEHECHTNKLYINNGDWTFTEVSDAWGVANDGCALATTFSDYDGDHDPDLLLANDFGAWIKPNALFQNRYPENSFVDVSKESGMDVGIYGMGITVGDYDHDLDLDYYITNLGRNVLLSNQNNGVFIDKTKESGVEDIYVQDSSLTVGWGTAFMDFDNDADLDLFVTNGYVPAAPFINNSIINPNRLFENLGDGTFVPIMDSTIASPYKGRGYVCSDIDNDGDLDFLVINVNKQATSDPIDKVQLYRNETISSGHWIQVNLSSNHQNKYGLGSKVYVYTAGNQFLQEANGGYGTHASQHSKTLHFGLGEYAIIDSIKVVWLGGESTTRYDVNVDQSITIQQDNSVSTTKAYFDVTVNLFPNPFKDQVFLKMNANENMNPIIIVTDLRGRIILEKEIHLRSGDQMIYPIHIQNPGLYIIKINSQQSVQTKKIIAN